MDILYKKLEKYHERGIYPFHMPGHKRNEKAVDFLPGLTADITEIEGFDQLHHPAGTLKDAQRAAARLFGADETFYSVNGSTGALLAAVCACTTPGNALLMARNCHKSVYHAVCLGQLDSFYLYPKIVAPYGLNGSIQPIQVEKALEARPDVQAVLITSPTYDGIVSPVGEIAEIVHRRGIPLIVDEAHGAHFPFHEYFPAPALEQGADVVVHSLHKTLPSLTQTALLHVRGERVEMGRIRRYMEIFQTSSPSYLLMGSMDACIRRLADTGPELFNGYVDRLGRLRERLSKLRYIDLVDDDLSGHAAVWDLDRSKLILDTRKSPMSGPQLYRWLWEEAGLQMEMEAETYVLGMTSIADTDEGYDRLSQALEDLEGMWEREGRIPQKRSALFRSDLALASGEKILPIGRAVEQPCETIPLSQSEGRIAGGSLYLYPPGIPLVVPGEKVTAGLIGMIMRSRAAGLAVQGLVDTIDPAPGIPVIRKRQDRFTDRG